MTAGEAVRMTSEPADPMREIKEIESRMTGSPGWRVVAESEALGRSFRVFTGNARELLRTLAVFGNPEAIALLWDVDRRVEFEAVLGEVDRQLHNYLASVKSLVDHTRSIVDGMYPVGSAFRATYEAEKDRLSSTARARFVQDLRNYTLHRRLPNPIGRLSMERDQPARSRVLLSTAELLEWDGWSAGARGFLQTAGDEIDLADVIGGYTQEVGAFYQWFGGEQEREHATELADLQAMRQELRAAFARAGLSDYVASIDERLAKQEAKRQGRSPGNE